MADKIRVNTGLLEKCAGELRTTAQGFGDAASILAGLDTSQEWWSKMGRINPLSLQDEGGTAELGDAGAAVRALTAILRRYDGRATALGNSTSRAASLFSDLESQLISKAGGQSAGSEGNVIGAVGAAAGVAGGSSAGDNSNGQGSSGNGGGKQLGDDDYYREETRRTPFGWYRKEEGKQGDTTTSREFRIGGKKSDWASEKDKTTIIGLKDKAEDKKQYDRHGKELAKDKDGEYVDSAKYTDKSGKEIDKKASASRKVTLIGKSKKVSADYSVIEASSEMENERGSVKAQMHGLRFQGYAEGSGGIYVDELKHGDKKSYGLEAGVGAAIGVSATLFDASAETTVHTPVKGVDAHASVETKVGNASAGAKAQVGRVGGKWALGVDASAEANLVEVGGKAGVKVGGVDATVGADVVVGVGAHAKAGYYDGVMKVDVGASVGIGASLSFEVDVGEAVENIKNNTDNIRKGVESAGKVAKKGLKAIQKGVSKGLRIW